jgi:hypothetical protein
VQNEVPTRRLKTNAQDCVLGYSQPSLAGLFLALIVYPGLASWATPSRPCGTEFVSGALTQTLKPNVFSVVYGPTKVVP